MSQGSASGWKKFVSAFRRDPAAQAQYEAVLRSTQGAVTAYRAHERPVLESLRAVGCEVDEVRNLRGRQTTHVVDVLVAGMSSAWPELNLDIIDVLKRQKGHARVVSAAFLARLEALRDAPGPGAERERWALADALASVIRPGDVEACASMATDERFGPARQGLARALGVHRSPIAERALLGLLDDPVTEGHAIVALGELKATSAAPAIRMRLGHREEWVRTEAAKALRTIGTGD